nr:hypothetical protein [uncultured Blautia sp.]
MPIQDLIRSVYCWIGSGIGFLYATKWMALRKTGDEWQFICVATK